jgi:hypothetical protein
MKQGRFLPAVYSDWPVRTGPTKLDFVQCSITQASTDAHSYRTAVLDSEQRL